MNAKQVYQKLVEVKIRFDVNNSNSKKAFKSIRSNAMRVLKYYKSVIVENTEEDLKYAEYLKSAEINIENMKRIIDIMNEKIN